MVNWLKKSYLEIFTSLNENNYNYKKSKYTANVLVSVLIFDKDFNNYLWPRYKQRILLFLEEIEEINNKNLENHGNSYLNIISKFSKFINKDYTEEEMERNLKDKSLEELAKEIIDEENLNKFLKEEHSKMIKKLMEEDEIFKKNIEGL